MSICDLVARPIVWVHILISLEVCILMMFPESFFHGLYCSIRFTELYALYRYIAAGPRTSGNSQAITSGTEQSDGGKGDKQSESELRLAQLQHQLPANEPGTLMHLMEDAATLGDEDEETKSCKYLFKNLKFYLSREVGFRQGGDVVTWLQFTCYYSFLASVCVT